MKILVIVPSYKPAYIYGGPIESVSRMCEGLVRRGHEVDVYTTTANGVTELDVSPNMEVKIDGVFVTYFTRLTKDHTHVSLKLWFSLLQNVKKYDIVHIQSWWSILVIVAALICHLKRAKVIISPRGMLSEYILSATNGRIKQIIHFCIGRFALSQSFYHATAPAEALECEELIEGWNGFVIPNVLNLPDHPIETQEHSKFKLIFLSRVHPKKGLEVLFEAISMTDIDLILQIGGNGDVEYVNSLKELAIRLGIANRIEWLGWVDRENKFNYLAKADLFILISQNENFANVVIESLHMGTPVLVSEQVALSYFVEKSDLGWVTSLNPRTVSQDISKAFMEIEKRRRIRDEGRVVVKDFFSEDALIANYEKAYLSIIK